MTKWLDLTIKWSFYLLFFLVPLVFFSGSFELFEYNKMMLTYALAIVISGAWLTKMVTQGKPNLTRTFLDIPILLYLGAHILSTIFSIDVHTSIWGYYSRFHEGLITTITYIMLYYAAVSNLKKSDVINILLASFASGLIVSVWGILEHFGNSPSCYFITGKGGVDCWIQDVKNRVFATLGQPNWMAAYLDVLILATMGLVAGIKKTELKIKSSFLLILAPIFFAALLFTKSRSGLIGLGAGLLVFIACFIFINRKELNLKSLTFRPLMIIAASCLALTVIFGLPFAQTNKFSLESLLSSSSSSQVQESAKPIDPGIRISESSDIRNIVWEGALKIWQRYPIFGSGVETFAYAYYKDRPTEHNMVSEWDFLYNKAHNEFLNILATTGLVGMLAYLSILGMFAWWFIKSKKDILTVGIFSAWITILVTNFFGFSVVIIGLFFFLIPAFCFTLNEKDDPKILPSKTQTLWHWVLIFIICIIAFLGLLKLLSMWNADKSFAYGKNLDGIQQYQAAYPYLIDAVNTNPDEPTFRDELAYNQSVLALAFHQQSSSSAEAKLLSDEAVKNSNIVLDKSPSILSFWKTRTRLFYNLAEIDQKYLFEALNSIRRAAELAPTDAKVNYNLGLLLGQTGDIKSGISVLERTVKMKPDYADAYYALGVYYDQIGNKNKAVEQMEYMLKNIGEDGRAKKWLEENKP